VSKTLAKCRRSKAVCSRYTTERGLLMLTRKLAALALARLALIVAHMPDPKGL
jgi:hypothetical protein